MEKIIQYFGQKAKVACDEKCNKAWGGNSRPRIYPEISDTKIFGLGDDSIYPDDDSIDVNDYGYCSDSELPEAPVKSKGDEGGDFKPISKHEIGNKWCIRECERCVMSMPNEHDKPLKLKDFSNRVYNIHARNRY